jgi:hypothetical protein
MADDERPASIYAYDSWAPEPVPVSEGDPNQVSRTSQLRGIYERALKQSYPRCSVCRRAMIASLTSRGEFTCPNGHRAIRLPAQLPWWIRMMHRLRVSEDTE